MVDQSLTGDKHEIDAVSPAPPPPAMSGTASRELNTPLPRWWLWLFYATIVWSIGYWIVYPSWPLVVLLHAPACSAGIRARRSRAISRRSRRSAGR